jgi:hypothetical protein
MVGIIAERKKGEEKGEKGEAAKYKVYRRSLPARG